MFAEIAVELPLEIIFTYSVPSELENEASVGKRALIPFGKRTVTGYIISITSQLPAEIKEAKPILDILDPEPIFDEKRLKFYKWLSSYYFSPLGEVLSLTHPGSANIKSQRYFKSASDIPSGKQGTEREILETAKDGIALTALLKRFKGKPVHSIVERLKKEGLISEEMRLTGGGTQRTEQFASPVKSEDTSELLKKSPIQAKVYKFLLENGEKSFTDLRKEFGEVTQAIKKLCEKGLANITERQVLRNPFSDIVPKAVPFEPNEEQAKAIDAITKAIKKNAYSPFLLYGVTGSGKTLVYLKILEEALKAGKKAVILAPEIALTPWPAAYLAERFPGRIALAHSGLSEGERIDEWGRILRGEADIIVGARSALFSPIKDLGLIIVDEEHETSYKQEDGVRYNARDAALMLGKHLGITVVLGSATPSVETFYNAGTEKLTPLYMRKRAGGAKLPSIDILNMKGKKGLVISESLQGLMGEAFKGGQQALLFLNRRGFSNTIICRDCGHNFSCLNCSVTLTMHKGAKTLKCHYCDLSIPLPDNCPDCSSLNLITPGVGTEKIEEEIRTLFPGVRVGRMDRDTTSRKGSAKKIIDAVEERKIDVLIGTQMVSKGHHFPGITLVGVISGDTSLNIPDFRSSERTFQLITQAAGRAGRGAEAGHVVIQTLNPEHYCFRCALEHDYESFYKEEIEHRRELDYPPFTRLCNLRLDGIKESSVIKAASELKISADKLLGRKDLGITILGPAPALLAKIKNRYRWQMLFKGKDISKLHPFIKGLKNSFEAKKISGVNLTIDMDPLTIV
ncbi:MAG: primosomal protein N' [Deltaproteobacteria bacterium]|nr:primosomal protein N' [Deltaproteobacteria bacterium]